MTRLLTMLLVVASLGLAACAPVVVGGVVTGGYLASQERGAKNAVWDLKIKTHVMERLTNANYKNIARIGVYVLQGDVLLTGIVQNQAEFDKIGDIARATPDVKEVFNKLQVGTGYSAKTYADDTWISTQIKSRMFAAKDVFTINYDLETVNAEVYIIGLASSTAEYERVLYIARTTKGVKNVHSYVRVLSPNEVRSYRVAPNPNPEP
jgi:osmotically-inducible protein OsmY